MLSKRCREASGNPSFQGPIFPIPSLFAIPQILRFEDQIEPLPFPFRLVGSGKIFTLLGGPKAPQPIGRVMIFPWNSLPAPVKDPSRWICGLDWSMTLASVSFDGPCQKRGRFKASTCPKEKYNPFHRKIQNLLYSSLQEPG